MESPCGRFGRPLARRAREPARSTPTVGRRLILVVAGCARSSSPPAQASVDGIWRSRGYGLVLEVAGDSLQAYEVTSTTCLPSLVGKRVPGSDPDAPRFDIDGAGTVELRPDTGRHPARLPPGHRVGHRDRAGPGSARHLRPSRTRHAPIQLRSLHPHVERAVHPFRRKGHRLAGRGRAGPGAGNGCHDSGPALRAPPRLSSSPSTTHTRRSWHPNWTSGSRGSAPRPSDSSRAVATHSSTRRFRASPASPTATSSARLGSSATARSSTESWTSRPAISACCRSPDTQTDLSRRS